MIIGVFYFSDDLPSFDVCVVKCVCARAYVCARICAV